jgi:succinate dehydrogenase/fumarate reductase cytochrome b subunit
MQRWKLPWLATVAYPGFLLGFDFALNGYRKSGSVLLALVAVSAIALAGAASVLAVNALLRMRDEPGAVLTRALIYLMCSVPSLFSLSNTLSRLAGIGREAFIGAWVVAWLAVGLLLYVKKGSDPSPAPARSVAKLRVVHGATALAVLCAFLLAHLTNHVLATWSPELHTIVLKSLRVWYRSNWVEPVLLTLMLVMIVTGVPMVLHYSRQRMDAFRVVQAATGVYVGVFLCSHVIAVLNGRRLGVETDWYFAAGPNSLLEGAALLSRLIPHYFFGAFFAIVHVACGLRIVLLKHGASNTVGNRAVYALSGVGLIVTLTITAALLGFHVEPTR